MRSTAPTLELASANSPSSAAKPLALIAPAKNVTHKPTPLSPAALDAQIRTPPHLPPRPLPQPGMLNSQAKTARKSAHIPSNRADGYSTSSSSGGKKPAYMQSPSTKTIAEGQEVERNPALLANGPETSRKSVSVANGNSPFQQSTPKQILPNSPQATRQSVGPPPLPPPEFHKPFQMAGTKRPAPGPADETASKSSRLKTATSNGAPIALELQTGVSGKKISRKHQIDKPTEEKPKKRRGRPQIVGTTMFPARPSPAQPQKSTARDPAGARTAAPPKPPTYQVPSHRQKSITPKERASGAGIGPQTPLLPEPILVSQPGIDGKNCPSGAEDRSAGVISISSSPISSPTLSVTSIEAIDLRQSNTGERNLPITIEDSGSDTPEGGLARNVGKASDRAPSTPESRSLPTSNIDAAVSSRHNRSKSNDSSNSINEGNLHKFGEVLWQSLTVARNSASLDQVARFVRGLETHLEGAANHAKAYYEKQPPKGVNYSSKVVDDYLHQKDGMRMIERFQFLLAHLRVYTNDGRVMMCSEACYLGISPSEGKFALTGYLEAWGLKPPSKPPGGKRSQTSLDRTCRGEKELEIPHLEGKASSRSPPHPSDRGPTLKLEKGLSIGGTKAELVSAGEVPKTEHSAPSQASYITQSRSAQPGEGYTNDPKSLGGSYSTQPDSAAAARLGPPVEGEESKPDFEALDLKAAAQSSKFGVSMSPTAQEIVPPAKSRRKQFSCLSVEEFFRETSSAAESRSKNLRHNSPVQLNDPLAKSIASLREREDVIREKLDALMAKSGRMEIEFAAKIKSAKKIGEMEEELSEGDNKPPLEGSERSCSVDWETCWRVIREQRNSRENLEQEKLKLVDEAIGIHHERMGLIRRRKEQTVMETEIPQRCSSTAKADSERPECITPTTSSSPTLKSVSDIGSVPPTGGVGTRNLVRGDSFAQQLFEELKTWAALSYSATPAGASATGPSGSEVGSKIRKKPRKKMNW